MMNQFKLTEFILYVENQEESTQFYKKIFRKNPDLMVPGMTEFQINEYCKIGIIPNKSIAKLLGNKVRNPSEGAGIPRCELYFYVENIEFEFQNAQESGAFLLSPITEQNWGDKTCYFADHDGHIIVFAEKM